MYVVCEIEEDWVSDTSKFVITAHYTCKIFKERQNSPKNFYFENLGYIGNLN